MVGQKKKGTGGEAARYITRTAALRKLQLSLPDFRRLCILKGVYPREPKNRFKAQKGDPRLKVLYLVKDIQFLMHEPIIWKFREHKAVMKKVKKHYERNEDSKGGALFGQRPRYTLDRIIKERYPTFNDALNDLEDPLTLAFLYTKMPARKGVKIGVINTSIRVTTEFLLYCIEAKALRKAFISIKGYYYQVEVMGQLITWVSPHNFATRASGVDHRVMKTFLELYLVLLSFVNYRLFTSLNLYYPPVLPLSFNEIKNTVDDDKKFSSCGVKEMQNHLLTTLNFDLKPKGKIDDDPDEEGIDMHLLEGLQMDEAKKAADLRTKQQTLFKDMKFFLGRETNLESLTFVIRSCSGTVSWEKMTAHGSTYQEDDESITHQIVDRPGFKKKYMSRYYVQPQWVYDCINAVMLLPVQDYFMGAVLPPHLSPFDQKDDELYVPPEQKALLARQRGEIPEDQPLNAEDNSDGDSSDDDDKVDVPVPKSYIQKLREREKKKKARKWRKKKAEREHDKEMAIIEGRAPDEGGEVKGKAGEEGATTNTVVTPATVEGTPQHKDTGATPMEEGDGGVEGEKDGDDGVEGNKDGDDGVEGEKDGEGEAAAAAPNKKRRRKPRKEPVVMEVTKGKKHNHESRANMAAKREEARLNIMMLPNKRRKLYWALKRKEITKDKKSQELEKKRTAIDEEKKKEKQETRKKLLRGKSRK
ncbi:hypothetical protein Pmani_016221 [Petrolisthes manimaculis]|uniref:Pescadillo homolog n=1 Tax=Petrolisthes manimaculis TaxID=1843537 RepID=A0AAE1PS86_9EUCA|nr:hypothetical protein Pmani_016221 [Petrolisthes manimaculis]